MKKIVVKRNRMIACCAISVLMAASCEIAAGHEHFTADGVTELMRKVR